MRVLFTARPGAGHLYPVLPLARAVQEAGHEALVAVAEGMRKDVENAHLLCAPTAHDAADLGALSLGLPPDRIRHIIFGQRFAGLELAERLPDVRRLVEAWRPDIVVHEVAEFAGALAAAAAGIPHATISFGPMIDPDVVRLAAESAAPLWRVAGLKPDPSAGIYSLRYYDICPPSLQVPALALNPVVRPMRPVPFGTSDTAPAGSLGNLHHPVVYFTMGTAFGRDAELFRTVIEGARELAGTLIVTIGGRLETAALGTHPPNVRIHQFIPQAQVLPHCDLMITHGGSGSLLGAMSAGLPVLLLPQGADQFYNSERVLAAGVGLVLRPSEITADAVAGAVRTLLSDPAYASRARAAAAEIAAMPSPADSVRDLEELVAPASR